MPFCHYFVTRPLASAGYSIDLQRFSASFVHFFVVHTRENAKENKRIQKASKYKVCERMRKADKYVCFPFFMIILLLFCYFFVTFLAYVKKK